jgi:hypothetical protein
VPKNNEYEEWIINKSTEQWISPKTRNVGNNTQKQEKKERRMSKSSEF